MSGGRPDQMPGRREGGFRLSLKAMMALVAVVAVCLAWPLVWVTTTIAEIILIGPMLGAWVGRQLRRKRIIAGAALGGLLAFTLEGVIFCTILLIGALARWLKSSSVDLHEAGRAAFFLLVVVPVAGLLIGAAVGGVAWCLDAAFEAWRSRRPRSDTPEEPAWKDVVAGEGECA